MTYLVKTLPAREGAYRVTGDRCEQFRDGEWRAYSRQPRTSPISAPPFAKERVSWWALLKWRK